MLTQKIDPTGTLRTLTAAIALLACWLTPCLAQSPSEQPIRIGLITTLTGPLGPNGQELVNGMNLYLDEVHHRMAGRPVELVVADDEGNPAAGVIQYERLVTEKKVDLIDGIILSNLAYAIAPHVDKFHVPVVLGLTAADQLTQNKRHPWIVRCSCSASQSMMPLGEYAYQNLHLKRVITIASDFPYGWENVGGFQKTFEQAGGKVVQKLWPPLGVTDYSEYLKRMRKDADAVWVLANGQSALEFPKQYKQYGGKLPLIGALVDYDSHTLKLLGNEAPIGAITSWVYCPTLSNAANRRFVSDYRRKYDSDTGLFSESGYTSGMFIARALESLNGQTDDKDKLVSALRKVELQESPRGPLKMDEYGNPIENVYVMRLEKVNGRAQNEVLQTYHAVSQFFKYNPQEYMKQPEYARTYPLCKYCQE